jgi:hypothetical protein
MLSIENNLEDLFGAFSKSQAVEGTKGKLGVWRFQRGLGKLLSPFKSEDKIKASTICLFNRWLDESERFPFTDFAKYLAFADRINQWSSHAGAGKFERTQAALKDMNRRIVALKYRRGQLSPNSEADKTTAIEELENLALSWKQKEKYPKEQKSILTEREQGKLHEALRHNEFASLLIKDEKLQKEFFSWALKDNNSVDVFIQFPGTQQMLKACYLNSRMGCFAQKKLLQIIEKPDKKTKLTKKVVAIKIEGKLVNIFRKKAVQFQKGNLSLKMEQIFEVFKNKNETVGYLEVFESGIENFNVFEWGYCTGFDAKGRSIIQRINFDDPNFLTNPALPVFATLSPQEAENRYGSPAKGKVGNFLAFRTSRESLNLNVDKSHGFLELVLPCKNKEGQDVYRVYVLGKLALHFPTKWYHYLFFIGATVIARISAVDDNYFYTHRQIATFVTELNEKELEITTEFIRKVIKQALSNNLVFQLADENCAFWPQVLFNLIYQHRKEEKNKNMLFCDFIRVEPQITPLKQIWKFLKIAPRFIDLIILGLIHLVLASWRGRLVQEEDAKGILRWKWKTSFLSTQFCIPAYLHKLIEDGRLPGKITYGHGEY